MSLAVRKRFLDLSLSFDYNRTSNVFADVNVCGKNHNFNIPLILDQYNYNRNAKSKIYATNYFCYQCGVLT